jgi:hypothetical protein
MATQRNTALFASPVDWNFYGYRIVNNETAKTAQNVTVGFQYKGYEVAMTSHDPAGSKVIVLLNKILVCECISAQAAIERIEELTSHRWPGQGVSARDVAMRRSGHH